MLTRYNLYILNMRGQGYDGVNNMYGTCMKQTTSSNSLKLSLCILFCPLI